MGADRLGPDRAGSDGPAAGDTVPWRDFLDEAVARLRSEGLPSPEVDARRILEEASGHEGGELVPRLDDPATVGGAARVASMVARRAGGEPLQYVLGRWGFRHLDLMVDRRVLIPRPETEVLVGVALDELERQADGSGALIALDLGTGSGAIALSLAAERDDVEVTAVERSADALSVARSNLAGLGRPATRVRMVAGSWFQPVDPELRGRVHLVVSNPPYVAETDELPSEVSAWEPTDALVAGPTGLEAAEAIIDQAGDWLRPRGALMLELAPGQLQVAAARAAERGFDAVDVIRDLAGRERILRARRHP